MKSTETLTLTKEEVEEAIRDYVHDRRGWRPGEVTFDISSYHQAGDFMLRGCPQVKGASVQRPLDSEE